MIEHDPGIRTRSLPQPAVFVRPADSDGAFAISAIDDVIAGTNDDAELALPIVGGVHKDHLSAKGADGELWPADHLHGGPAFEGDAHGAAGFILFAGMDERHVVAIHQDFDEAAVGFRNDDADE